MAATDVLIAGAGPVGLTAAIELRRRGVACRIVDRCSSRRSTPRPSASSRAPWSSSRRWASLRQVLDAAIELRGQIVYVNGQEVGADRAPAAARRSRSGSSAAAVRDRADPAGAARRARDADRARRPAGRVRAGRRRRHRRPRADRTARRPSAPRYLVGCDGAHSVVRKTLGPQLRGRRLRRAVHARRRRGRLVAAARATAVRSMHQPDGRHRRRARRASRCPADGRYRMSMLVPSRSVHGGRRRRRDRARVRVRRHAHRSSDIQAVLDRLAPEPTTASQPALVLGVPDQPPHRRPLRPAAGSSSPATPRTSTRPRARRA